MAEGPEAAGEELLLTVLKGLNPAGYSANTPGKTYPWEQQRHSVEGATNLFLSGGIYSLSKLLPGQKFLTNKVTGPYGRTTVNALLNGKIVPAKLHICISLTDYCCWPINWSYGQCSVEPYNRSSFSDGLLWHSDTTPNQLHLKENPPSLSKHC